MAAQPSPTGTHADDERYLYPLLLFSLSFLYAAALPTINSLIFSYYVQSRSAISSNPLSNPVLSVPIFFGYALLFFFVFYRIGERVSFQRNYARAAILIYAGGLAYYSLGLAVAGQSGALGSGFSAEFEQQALNYLAQALGNFGILFGALSLAFLRQQLPNLGSPPLELMTYRPRWILGAVAAVSSFTSPVLSGLVAALFLLQHLFVDNQDPFYFVRYYFSGTDPLYVNYLVYPVAFMILIYYLGMKTDFNRMVGQTLQYLFLGGLAGYAIGVPLGMYLRIFFNPPSPSSSIPLLNSSFLPASLYHGLLVALLGLSVLAIALLRRRSDLPIDESRDRQEDVEEASEGLQRRMHKPEFRQEVVF